MFSNLSERDDDRAVLVRIDLADNRPGQDHGAGERELFVDRLFEFGASGVEERDGPDGSQLLLAGFPNRLAAAAALERLPPALRASAMVEVPEDTWFDGWRAYARAQRAGRHLIVHPPWVPLATDPPVGPEDLVLEIDPGRAFGSGAHPTTRLVLAAMEEVIEPGDRVLDVGSGSGVLAVAAVKLGATDVVAVDNDPAAVAASAANRDRNGVSFVVDDRLDDHRGPFDLVVANIGANTLIELAPVLLERARRVVVSGFFAGRADEVLEAYTRCGAKLEYRSVDEEDGWTALRIAASTSEASSGSTIS